MWPGVLTQDDLDKVVNDYLEFDEFCLDVETKGANPLDPLTNEVFWISLAGPGRADAIPCGHPLGERIEYDPDDTQHRISPQGKHQERRINPSSGREKWFDVQPPFTDPPKQLWISDVVETLRPLVFSNRRKVGQNIIFDLLSLGKYFGETPPPPYGDTLIAAKLINENYFAYNLDAILKRTFGFEYTQLGKKGPQNFPFSEAYLYSYLDSKYDWLLWQLQKKELEEENVFQLFEFEMDLMSVVLDMEKTGIRIDRAELFSIGEQFSKDMAALQVEIDKAAGWPVNLNANKQVADLVYGTLGKKCTKFSKLTQAPSVAKDALEVFSKNKTVAAILEHGSISKLQSTFVEGITSFLGEDDCIHPHFNQVGAGTGRFSASKPNVQQISVRSERGKLIRKVFVPRPGNLFVVADLSQIELRVLAHFTQDKNLLRAYREGLDLHAMTAEKAFGPDFTPEQRSLGKTANFATTYGAEAATLVARSGFPNIRVAEQVLNGFYAAYPRVNPWKDRAIEEARSKYRKNKTVPYAETILGRKRRLPDMMSVDWKTRARAERQIVSVIIQGSAADLFKSIMIDCHSMLQECSWEGHILMTIHDEVVVEVPEKHSEEGLELVKRSMEEALNPFTGEPFLRVPIVADAKLVSKWAEAKN